MHLALAAIFIHPSMEATFGKGDASKAKDKDGQPHSETDITDEEDGSPINRRVKCYWGSLEMFMALLAGIVQYVTTVNLEELKAFGTSQEKIDDWRANWRASLRDYTRNARGRYKTAMKQADSQAVSSIMPAMALHDENEVDFNRV